MVNLIDRLISVFSPRRGLLRQIYRDRLEARTQYAAAKTNRLTGVWSPLNTDVNSIIRESAPAIRARARQLVRDFPYFSRALQVIVDYTVGTGLVFQSSAKIPGTAEADPRLIRQIEELWERWMEQADSNGKLHLYEMMRLAKRQEAESGEFLLVADWGRKRGPIPVSFTMYESEALSDSIGRPAQNNVIHDGIEYSPKTGIISAYHFKDLNNYNKTYRVPARDVIHGFEMQRPGQMRGVSIFSPAILIAHDLSDYMDAEIDAAKMAAKWLAVVETPDPFTFQESRTTTDDGSDQRLEELENAIIEYLRPGESIKMTDHNRPGESFGPFVRLMLRMISVSSGISYELLTGDYDGINYSNLRGIRNDILMAFNPIRGRFIRQFCNPIFRIFMNAAVLSGEITLPGYNENPWPYLRGGWLAPGSMPIDPLKEGRADIEQMQQLLVSPQELALRRGRDYADILHEIADARKMQQEAGLEPEATSLSATTNPTEVMGSDTQSKMLTGPWLGAARR